MDLLMLPDFSEIARLASQPFVEKGVAYLDEYHPDWWEKIHGAITDNETFDMAHGEYCICGWVFGEYGNRPRPLMEGHEYGFAIHEVRLSEIFRNVDDDFGRSAFDIIDVWPQLERLWLDEIWWRVTSVEGTQNPSLF